MKTAVLWFVVAVLTSCGRTETDPPPPECSVPEGEVGITSSVCPASSLPGITELACRLIVSGTPLSGCTHAITVCSSLGGPCVVQVGLCVPACP